MDFNMMFKMIKFYSNLNITKNGRKNVKQVYNCLKCLEIYILDLYTVGY